MTDIVELWRSADPRLWDEALAHYWDFVQPRNLELERQMELLDIARVQRLDARGWYDFLLNEYFRWKYTAPNRYASTTKHLRRYEDTDTLAVLGKIKDRFFAFANRLRDQGPRARRRIGTSRTDAPGRVRDG